MSWLDWLRTGLFGAPAAPVSEADQQRALAWESALQSGRLPSFVEARLAAAASGKAPWVATLTPAELALARHKGIRPLAMVSGTCWFHYGWSWTEGHAEGWNLALARLRQEAIAAGANAIVDVKLRKIELALRDSMDFTVLGTAVRVDGLPASPDPIVVTAPALEFLRLLEAGIVPVGIAIGAQYDYLSPVLAASAARLQGSTRPFTNAPLTELGEFWERVRRTALTQLRQDAKRQGNGVLAHTHFGQLLRIEDNDNPRFLGRHIVIGTVVDTGAVAGRRQVAIHPVIDMRDDASPLLTGAPASHNAYPVSEQEGMI